MGRWQARELWGAGPLVVTLVVAAAWGQPIDASVTPPASSPVSTADPVPAPPPSRSGSVSPAPRAYRIYLIQGGEPIVVSRYTERDGQIGFERYGGWVTIPRSQILRVVPDGSPRGGVRAGPVSPPGARRPGTPAPPAAFGAATHPAPAAAATAPESAPPPATVRVAANALAPAELPPRARPAAMLADTAPIASPASAASRPAAIAAGSEASPPPRVAQAATAPPTASAGASGGAALEPEPDRWRLLLPGATVQPRAPLYDPYNPNVLKGDYPILGDKLFLSLTGVLDTFVDQKRNLDFTSRIRDVPFHADNTLGQATAVVTVDLFHGDTVFAPRDWAIRVSPIYRFRCNDDNAQDHQCASFLTLFEAFGEAKLFEIGPTFDATSARVGLQVFSADFFGFVYNDVQPGARIFSELARNRFKLNLAGFDRLSKDGLTALNRFDRREHQVGVASLEWDDFLWPGFNILPNVVVSRDDAVKGGALEAYYVGVAASGRLGRLNVNGALNAAFGETAANTPTGRRQDIIAGMAFGQAAYPIRYWVPRLALLYASGDRNPTDNRATGFDSVFDTVNFGGGQFSYLFGEKIQLGATTLWRGNSVFPSLRGANATSQFVNPGVLVVNPGLDVFLTPRLLLETNYNYVRFDDTASLEALSQGRKVSQEVGHEVNMGFTYKPFLNEQVLVFLGGAAFIPGDGIRDLFGTSRVVYKGLIRVVLTY